MLFRSQDEISKKYGIDTARLFLMFVASPEKLMEWQDEGIEGSFKFINKAYALSEKEEVPSDEKILNKIHRTIKIVTESIETFQYNKAIIHLMSYTFGMEIFLVQQLYKQLIISEQTG